MAWRPVAGGESGMPIAITIPVGQTDSEWFDPIPSGANFRLPSLETDGNCPSTTLTLSARDPEDQVAKSVQNFSLDVGPNQAFGASDLATLSSLLDRREWRWTLGTAPTSDCTIILRIT